MSPRPSTLMGRRILQALFTLGLWLAAHGPCAAEDIPSWLPKYHLAIDIQPDQRRVTAIQRITFTNRHDRPAHELVFCAYARYKIPDEDVGKLAKTVELLRARPSENIDFEGRRLEVSRVTTGDRTMALPFHWREDMQTTLVVPLPRPVHKGESVTIEIAFTLSLPEKAGRWGYNQGVTALTNWYPMLAYYDDQGWQPTPFIAWHQPFFNEAGVYAATVRLPREQKLACTGSKTRRQDNGDGTQTVEIVAAAARDFTLVCSARYQEWTRVVEDRAVHVLAFPEHAAMAEQALAYACEVIPLYNRWFGAYPFTDFYIVESYFPWNGNQNAGLVQIDHRVFGMPSIMVKYLDHLVSHETLHQWWWNVVGVNGYAETFMDEAVACFYTARRMQKKYGRNAPLLEYPFGQSVLVNVNHEDYRFYGLYGTLARKEETKTVQPLPDFGHLFTLFSMCYDRGAKVLGMIEDRIGETAFLDFMRIVFTRYQFRILRVKDFQRELEEYTGYSWKDFFERWLYGVGGSDWVVAKATVEPLAQASAGAPDRPCQVVVRLEQRAEFTEPTVLGVKFTRDGPYDLRIPIRLTAAPEEFEGCRVELQPDGQTVLVTMLLPREPAQITVDPDQVLLDKNPANNHWKCELNARITPLMTNLDETDLTTAYDRWNVTLGPWLGLNQPQFGQRPYAGARASLYRLQSFQGGIYTAFDGVDRDLRVGADSVWKHCPWPSTEFGFQYDHSLTGDWANLKRDRGRLYGRYIRNETSSMYLDPMEFIEAYFRVEQEFQRSPSTAPPGVQSYDDSSGVGLRYFRNYYVPYWDPEGGYQVDLNYELGLPIVGDYDFVYNRIQGRVGLVKGLPDGLGYLSQTRLALRAYGGIGLPDNGFHFQLGGPTFLRGFQRNDRQGDTVWLGTIEWRAPIWQRADVACCDRIFKMDTMSIVAFYDVGGIYLNGQLVGGNIAHAVGGGLRFDITLLGFIERVTLRFDVAKTVNAEEPVQFWFGLGQAF
jgi:hypothetical protein